MSGFTYDALNRLKTSGFGATIANPTTYTSTITNTWDAANRLTQIADSVSGSITRQYDSRFDTLTQEVTPLGASTATVNYQYDTAGRRTQMQVVGQTAVTYGYDNANRLTGVTQGSNAVGFTYDAASRRTLATLPNLVTIDYGYDDANELTALTYKRSGATLQALAYGYDAAGRRTSMSGTAARINLPPALASATYDANNRLTNWAGAAQTYDFNGNLTNDGVNTYTWDVRDRLTALSGSIPIINVYDAFNRRSGKTQSGVQNGWIYDGFSELHTTSGTVVTNTLLNGLGLDERYARTSTGTTILPDAQGSTLSLVASSGAITGNFTYEPYGMSTQSGADTTSFRYTGRSEDTPNLLYYRARFYNPRTSRFISEDPIGLAGGYNLYAYVGGNPTNATDPTGLDTLVFNGGNLRHYDDNWALVGSYPATSGRDGVTNPSVSGKGPIPPGLYELTPKNISEAGFWRQFTGDWGRYRVPLTPVASTNTFGRDGFFLHGGKKPGSQGCIDVGPADRDIFPTIRSHDGPIQVLVY